MFHIVQLSVDVTPEQMEELGSKPKFWFTHEMAGHKIRFLFKADDRGTGEDWAEKISCELCSLLGIPHVHYEMALQIETGRPGVICQSCVRSPAVLILANQLLVALDPSYPTDRPRYKAERHTIEAAVEVLGGIGVPSHEWCDNLPKGIHTALDVFVGYLMLDAWIANQDRHHENWAAIFLENELTLSPTFDHGAALARNIKDDEREKRLLTRDSGYNVMAFAKKARSAFYSDASPEKTLTTHDAWRAISSYAPEASAIWLERLRTVEEEMVGKILLEVPPERLTAVGRDFTAELLKANRSLLLDGV